MSTRLKLISFASLIFYRFKSKKMFWLSRFLFSLAVLPKKLLRFTAFECHSDGSAELEATVRKVEFHNGQLYTL